MDKEPGNDGEVMRAARAIRRLRDRYKVSQRKAAEHHPDKISYQYWNMHEVGRVPGIEKPSTIRKLLDAISSAAALGDNPLTMDDYAEAARQAETEAEEDPRAQRMARSLSSSRPERQAVFPTSDGDVVFTFPADLSDQGFRELEAYFDVFVKARVNAKS